MGIECDREVVVVERAITLLLTTSISSVASDLSIALQKMVLAKKKEASFSFLDCFQGFFVTFSLFTNVYVILLFHRMHSTMDNDGYGPPPLSVWSQEDEKYNVNVDDELEIDWGIEVDAPHPPSVHLGDEKGVHPISQTDGPKKQRRPRFRSPVPQYNPNKRPKGWEKHGRYKLRAYFKCHEYGMDPNKPLPTIEYWNYFKRKYREIVDEDAEFDETVSPVDGYNFHNGNPPPYYAGHGERGRGLFASRDIKQGELVQDGTKSDTLWPSGMALKEYVFNLPRERACDIIDWMWVQRTEVGGDHKLFSAFNISILLNGSRSSTNINPDTRESQKFYALRHIKKGEELLADYEIYSTNWKAVGLGDDYIKRPPRPKNNQNIEGGDNKPMKPKLEFEFAKPM